MVAGERFMLGGGGGQGCGAIGDRRSATGVRPSSSVALGLTSPLRPPAALTQVDSLEDERVVMIACGGAHSAAVCADGSLYTWGKNHHGQLGHGDVASESEPRKVATFGERVGWVSCGGSHTAVLAHLGSIQDVADDASTARSSDTASFNAGSFNAARAPQSSTPHGSNRTFDGSMTSRRTARLSGGGRR